MSKVEKLIYESTRGVLKIALESVIREFDASIEHAKRKTVTTMDVVYAFRLPPVAGRHRNRSVDGWVDYGGSCVNALIASFKITLYIGFIFAYSTGEGNNDV